MSMPMLGQCQIRNRHSKLQFNHFNQNKKAAQLKFQKILTNNGSGSVVVYKTAEFQLIFSSSPTRRENNNHT
jgi:hypothetical protein